VHLAAWLRVLACFGISSTAIAQEPPLTYGRVNLAAAASDEVDNDIRRQAAERALITQALDAFKDRAELIAKQLGRSDYRIVRLDVTTGDGIVQPQFRAAPTMAMEAAVAPPTLEAGSQRVNVTVAGTIELQVQ
jgi:predicted secreted protein